MFSFMGQTDTISICLVNVRRWHQLRHLLFRWHWLNGEFQYFFIWWKTWYDSSFVLVSFIYWTVMGRLRICIAQEWESDGRTDVGSVDLALLSVFFYCHWSNKSSLDSFDLWQGVAWVLFPNVLLRIERISSGFVRSVVYGGICSPQTALFCHWSNWTLQGSFAHGRLWHYI